jgi:alpha-tubulin suppressor-like RCC1 family protein
VSGQRSFSRVTAGVYHTCAETTNNRAYCWGHNRYGALGNGTTNDHPQPESVVGDLWFTQVAAGSFYTCGVTDQFRAYCWGLNDHGELGDGTKNNSTIPVAVAGTT